MDHAYTTNFGKEGKLHGEVIPSHKAICIFMVLLVSLPILMCCVNIIVDHCIV